MIISAALGKRMFVGVCLVYLVLAIATATVKRPGCDEAWFADPAFTLMTRGFMGTPVLEQANILSGGRNFHGIDRYTYWIMPLYVLVQTAWYKVVGFGLFQMRALSMFWGLVALVAWCAILRALSDQEWVPWFGCLLIGLDYTFIRGGAHGRMDMMCAALNAAGIAVYLTWRTRNLMRAVFFSHLLVAASVFTHPNGILAFAGLLFLMAYYDRRAIGFLHLLVAAVPYLAGAAGWGSYILQAPDVFQAQFKGNAANRLWSLTSPLMSLKSEIDSRYLGCHQGLNPAKIALVVFPALGIGLALGIRAIRQHPGYRPLIVMAAINFVYFWLFEGTKLYLYTIHVTPYCMALLAASLYWLWENGRVPKLVLAGTVAAAVLVQVAGVAAVIKRD